MKKKILFTIVLAAILSCLFVISIGAAQRERYQSYEVELVDGTRLTVYEAEGWEIYQGRIYLTDNAYLAAPVDTEATYEKLDWTKVKVIDFTKASSHLYDANSGEYQISFGRNYGGTSLHLYTSNFTKGNLTRLEKVITGNVTNIGAAIFQKVTTLKEVVFSEALMGIANNAFDGCTSLEEADFSDCPNFTSLSGQVFYNCSGLKNVVLSPSFNSLGEGTFLGCSSLPSFDWPTSLKKIPSGTFNGCTSLQFEIPSYITEIGGSAFRNCDSITEFNVPAGVTTIGGHAFADCDNLLAVNFPENNQVTGNFTGIIFNCPKITSFTIPSGVTSLGYDNFWKCTLLTEIDLSGITKITGGNNFADTGITKLEFSNALESLPAGNINSKIEEIRFGANIKSIGEFNFHSKTIKRIYLPATITALGARMLGYSNPADSSMNITFIFTGTEEQASALQLIYKNAQTDPNIAPNSSKFYDAELVSAKDYDVTQEPVGFHLVYDYSACDAFYDGTHQEKAPYNAFKGDKYITDFCQYADCNRCTNTVETKLHGPLFISKGYSKSADAFMFDMKVDFDAIAEYEALGGTVPSYGLVVSGNATISELIGLDGNVVDTSVLKVNFDEGSYNNVQVKLNNILTDTSKAMKIHACAYVIDSESVYYVGEGKATTASTMICYNDIQGEEEVTPEETPAE